MKDDTSDSTDIAARFADLGTLDIPRQLDPGAVSAGGRKRLRRRRLLAGTAAVGTAAAAVAGVMAVSGALLTGPDQDGPGVPAAGTSQAPTPTPSPDRPTPKPSKQATPGPGAGPRSDPLMGWTTHWKERMTARGLRLEANASMFDANRGETESHGAVRRDGKIGYAAFMGTTNRAAVLEAQRNPCQISRFPKDGTGAQCRQQGDYWVKTYQDSNQGRVVLVRVVTDRADVLLAQSVGFPSYKSAITDSVNLLPWDLRDPVYPEDPSRPRKDWPELDRDPLPVADLAAVAKEIAASVPR